jgi:hypothetical protein
VITFEDGGTATLGTTTVIVPPGAVATTTTITIQETPPSSVVELAAGFERVGPVVALLPHGQTFLQPVQVTLGHTRGSALTDPVVLRLDDEVDTTWDAILPASFDDTRVTYSTTTFSAVTPAVTDCGPMLVISAIFTFGGYSAAQPNNDYIELHNRSTATLKLDGLALQLHDGSSPTTWTVVPLSGTLAPGGYYLVGFGRNTVEVGTPLPTPDASGMSNLSASDGRVAVTIGTTALTGGPPWSFHSAVAFGSTNHELEGDAVPAAALTVASVLARGDLGCAWTKVNADDLAYTSGRAPMNSASTPLVCSCD